MTDTSLFQPEAAQSTSQILGPSTFDVSQIDKNLRQISVVERTWSLPQLPDAVKLDLAAQPGATEDSLAGLLHGIDQDMSQPTIDEEEEPSLPGLDQARLILAGIAGEPAPTKTTPDAVRLLKKRAVDEGYIKKHERLPDNDTWFPELNGVRGEMAFDDYNSRMRGNREGAMPLSGAMKLLNDFTSPTGLLAAATELDLWFDFGAISNEFSSWGDKWRKLSQSKGPLDFAGNLIDALTGPLDDIIIPVVNVGLLATGVGAVAQTARVGWMGAKVASGGRLLEGLYSTGRALQNWERLGDASWLAQKLGQSGGTIRSTIGGGMSAWRDATAVKAVRGTLQPAMRLGFAQEIEERIPGYQGAGPSIGDIGSIGDIAQTVGRFGQAPASLPFELFLAPYNIWTPGTFFRSGGEGANLISRGIGAAGASLGTVAGRAAAGGLLGVTAGALTGDDAGDLAKGGLAGAAGAALLPTVGRALSNPLGRVITTAAAGAGAGALLGSEPEHAIYGAIAGAGLIAAPDSLRRFFPSAGGGAMSRALDATGRALQMTSFAPLADDQRVVAGFDRAMRSMLRNDPQRLEEWEITAGHYGVTRALANLQGSDDATASATIAFSTVSAAIDHSAQKLAHVGGYTKAKYHLHRNKLINQMRFFDLSAPSESTLDQIAWSAAFTEASDLKGVHKAFRAIRKDIDADPDRAIALADAHNQVAQETIRQLMSAQNMPLEGNMIGAYGGLSDLERAGVLETYLPQIGDTFGDFPAFASVTDEIRALNTEGLLDGMTFAPAYNRKGHKVVPTEDSLAGVPVVSPTVRRVNRGINEILFGAQRVDVEKARRFGRFTPLARSLNTGRPTVMLKETLDKQQVIELSERVADVVDAGRKLRGLKPAWRADVSDAAAQLGLDPTVSMGTYTRNQVKSLVNAAASNGNKKSLNYVIDFAKRKGLSLDQLDDEVDRLADELLDDAELWSRVGVEQVVRSRDGVPLQGLDALAARLRVLDEKAKYTAARIDVDQLRDYVRETNGDEGAERIQHMIDGLDRDGYKLVHGVEFLMPEDLAHGPIFRDVTARHLNAATFGNWFRGKLPIEARAIEDRRQRMALVDELEKAGRTLTPDADEVGWALEDLHSVLREYQDTAEAVLLDIKNQNFFERKRSAIQSSFTPIRLDDLGQKKKKVVDVLVSRGWSDDEAQAIWRATNRFRRSEFKDVGLYGLEAKLRSSNQIAWALKTASGSKHFEGLTDPSPLRKLWAAGTGKRYVGAAFGAAYGRTTADDDASFEERLGMTVLGALGGAAAATVLPRLAGAAGVDFMARHAANWRFGYMADNLARIRDSLRFTLSPFFDISRYTEGLMLAQTAAPLRKADGSRLALPLNMSPTGLRRSYRKELQAAGATSAEAQRGAWGRYDDMMREFNAAARGDYDPDVLDSTGKWFRQIGIMGFSPTDWMSTAFAQLKRQGLGSEEAYKAARSMYTYGTTGRSAAELSVNFVFFPFSFQKKALTHLAHWMNDDLSRSLMIHDALKTYEILDQQYNLDEYWRDHLPALQQLQKLNLFAFGISPGRFGGMNRQIFESGGKVAWNMFVPAGMEIKDATVANELQETMRSLTPALNDINWMIQNVKEQGHVLMSDSHVTTAAEARQGYDAWQEFREGFEAELDQKGYRWADLREPWLQDLNLYYEAKRAELADRYPAWQRARTENIQNIQAMNMEKQLRLDRVTREMQGGEPASLDDHQLAEFETFIESMRADLKLVGETLDEAPPGVHREIRERAVRYAEQNPSFGGLWEKFYRREYGPIEVPILKAYTDMGLFENAI